MCITLRWQLRNKWQCKKGVLHILISSAAKASLCYKNNYYKGKIEIKCTSLVLRDTAKKYDPRLPWSYRKLSHMLLSRYQNSLAEGLLSPKTLWDSFHFSATRKLTCALCFCPAGASPTMFNFSPEKWGNMYVPYTVSFSQCAVVKTERVTSL